MAGDCSEFSRFVRDLAVSLRAKEILYMGCGDIGDLSEFPEHMRVHGITCDPRTLERAVEEMAAFEFRQGDPLETPYGDGRFDFVFAHGLFGGPGAAGGGGGARGDAGRAAGEMYRVSSKYIASFEAWGGGGREEPRAAGAPGHYHDLNSMWSGFKVTTISNVRMHAEIDPRRSQFTLVRKDAA